MFVENKKKITALPIEEGEIDKATTQNNVKYISTLNTRRNPDLLVPGGKFLKGSHYFKGNETKEQEKGASGDESDVDSKESEKGNDEFKKMM